MKALTLLLMSFFILTLLVQNVNSQGLGNQQISLYSDNGLFINSPDFETIKQNTGQLFHWHISNKSNGVAIKNTNISCMFHLYNEQTQNHLIEVNGTKDANQYDFTVNVSGGNFSFVGEYSILIDCIQPSTNLGDATRYKFYVTPTGEEITTPKALLYVSFLFVFIILMGLCVFAVFQPIDEKLKLFWFLIAYLFLIGIFFILQQLASYYLYQTFIDNLAYILWMFLMFGFVPLLIWIVALIVVSIVQNKEMQSLAERGVYT